MQYYQNNTEYLEDELCYINAIIASRVELLEEQTNWQIVPSPDIYPWLNGSYLYDINVLRTTIDNHIAQSLCKNIELNLIKLVRLFKLERLETDILLLCLAPLLDQNYKKLYSYLQNEPHFTQLSVHLLAKLLGADLNKQQLVQKSLQDHATLIYFSLIQKHEGNRYSINSRVAQYLLGCKIFPAELHTIVEPIIIRPQIPTTLHAEIMQDITALLNHHQNRSHTLLIYLQGRQGAGKRTLAESIGSKLQAAILLINIEQLLDLPLEQFAEKLILIERERRLLEAICYWQYIDAILSVDKKNYYRVLMQTLEQSNTLNIIAGHVNWQYAKIFTFTLDLPDYQSRLTLWQNTIQKEQLNVADEVLIDLAQKFQLTPGQIETAAHLAGYLPGQPAKNLLQTIRSQVAVHLGDLAKIVKPSYTYQDIILPRDQQEQLDELIAYIKYYATVFEKWGFQNKLPRGKGMLALFTGPPGTGKTMAAEIIANTLSYSLYKIDLSAIVSKYIGETEKNLERIFSQAETSNIVLFFDEADALFSKRSEVESSNDRYANLETSYLLQKIETYSGIIILASNFKSNIDEAFIRRLQFHIDFTLPDYAERLTIWQKIWPKELPLSPTVDATKLAKLEFTGGYIRNIALTAAFKAAELGAETIELPHILHGIQRETKKLGRIVNYTEIEKLVC